MTEILMAAIVIGATGLCIGLLLGVAGKKFAVEVDETEEQIRELLPGNNCGGCGYAGCDALAKAIAGKEAAVSACPVGGSEMAKAIAELIGVEASEEAKKVAYVACKGSCDKTTKKYEYHGTMDCRKAAMVPGRGEKGCQYGCMGLGACVTACPFDAIHIVDGIAKVDKEACKACGKCISVCPNSLIQFVPYDAKVKVSCSSKSKGKDVKSVCSVGCIGCGLCTRQCEFGAITVEDNVARIDTEKCTGCGKCAEKCPVKIIEVC